MTIQPFLKRLFFLSLGLVLFFFTPGCTVTDANMDSVKHAPAALEDLPMTEVPARPGKGDTFAILFSGDGGWAEIDKRIASGLSEKGIPVAGVSSLSYFWSPRTPESAAHDLDSIISHYRHAWNKDKVLLMGYSFGADALPFMINRLPAPTRNHVSGIVLISPAHHADFEITLLSWLEITSSDSDYILRPEVGKLSSYPLLCVAGREEKNCLCRDNDLPWVKSVLLPGGHHMGEDYDAIVRTIVSELHPGEARP